jgi:uncharacterized protein YbcI
MDDSQQRTGPFDPIENSEQVAGPPQVEAAEAIATDLLRIHNESYGGSATKVMSHIVGDTLIVLMDDLELLPNEEFLVEAGKQDAVVRLRTEYQKAIEPTFRAAVERAMGRRVIAFTSHVHLWPPRFGVEIFRLEPR